MNDTTTSVTVPLWLVRNGSGHPRALVLAADSKSARTCVGGKTTWRTEVVGFNTIGVRVSIPHTTVLFPIMRMPMGVRAGGGRVDTGPGSPVDMLTAAAATFGYTFAHARYNRDPQACKAKQATWHVMVRLAGWSRSGTGRAFGFDHSTVTHGLARADEHIASGDDSFARAVAAVRETLTPPRTHTVDATPAVLS